MTEKEIIEGNPLIAEFMEATINPAWKDKPTYTYQKDQAPTPHSCYNWAVDEMQYHSSWDWLMPVVEKIAAYSPDHEFDINIGKTFCSVYLRHLDEGRYLYNVYGSDDKPLPAMYQAVVQFTTWYNSQPNQQTSKKEEK
jgi:hypothetical protein